LVSLYHRAIHTYNNQGTTARHARARDHVVVYSANQPPPLVPGEDEVILQREPIRVTLDPKGEALLPSARLNLAKLYTVEHNIPTYPVGKISSRCVELVKRWCSEVQGIFAPLPDVGEGEEVEDDV
jgi:hypothetical protein